MGKTNSEGGAVAVTNADTGVLNPWGPVAGYFIHPRANFSKLATKEDRFHMHKTLGILSVLSFVYRYGVVYPATGELGLSRGGHPFDWATMLVHTLLAFSSIIFRVPSRRIATKPMVIYEEYRQHAIVFTCRCLSVFAIATLMRPDPPFAVIPVVLMGHHLLVDRITARWGNGSTSVRANSDRMEVSPFYQKVARLYSFYQFLALGSVLAGPARLLPDLAYNSIIAIQSSAFMMTLYRKRIVRGRTHMLVYSLCLLLSTFHIVRIIGPALVGLIAAAFALRINLPRRYSSKYAIWALFLLACNWELACTTLMDTLTTPAAELGKLDAVRGVGAALVVWIGFALDRGELMPRAPQLLRSKRLSTSPQRSDSQARLLVVRSPGSGGDAHNA